MAKTIVRTHFRIRYLLIIFLLPGFTTTRAQQGKGYAIHANIIYHFTKYIDWPEEMKSGDFIIGIFGESPLYDELKRVTANKTVRGKRIVIKQYSTSTVSFYCHLLFVPDEESDEIKKIAAKTIGHSVLLVAETEGAVRKGACINFVVIDDRLRLEISKPNLEKRDLSIATELLQLGTVVK